MSCNNSTSEEELESFKDVMSFVLLFLNFPAAILNLIVIIMARRLLRESGDPVHLCILSMTLGDLVVTGLASPLEILHRKAGLWLARGGCIVLHFANWLGLAASGLSLTLLNLDKLIYFRYPLHYERWMSHRRCRLAVFAIWAVCLGFGLLAMYKMNIDTECVFNIADQITRDFYDAYIIIFCILPVVSSAALSAYLFVITRRQVRAVDRSRWSPKLRSLLFIFATTAWTAVSLLPFRVFNLFRFHIFDPKGCTKEFDTMSFVGWGLIFLLMFNPVVNPVLTSTIYVLYRNAFSTICAPVRRRLSNSSWWNSNETLWNHIDTNSMEMTSRKTSMASNYRSQIIA